jgi:hypothetical protein
MICESHDKLPDVENVGSMTIVRFEFQYVEAAEDMPGKWIYHEISIPKNSGKGDIVNAILSDTYTRHDEIGLINNKVASLANAKMVKEAAEYATYQSKRAFAKQLAETVIGLR